MPKIITYSLKLDNTLSNDDYYSEITAFAKAWQESVYQETSDLIAKYRARGKELNLSDRSDNEYAFELLVIGVLLREHGKEIAGMTGIVRNVLKRLVRIQKHWPRTEKMIKRLRGWIGELAWYLTPKSSGQAGTAKLSALLEWLRAHEEYGKADRLAEWLGFLDPNAISRCLTLADRFAAASQAALGKYTEQVPGFLINTAPKHRWQYDAEFVARTRTEYHLGMLGTEVLNRAYRQRFLGTTKQIVIVPPCMRLQPEEDCKAVSTPYGTLCQACTPACRVHQLTRLGEKQGFDVFIMPDELRVFGPGSTAGSQLGQVGVVGVACALTNWSGGWDVDGLGIPAQGLLLDYCGCSYHWDKTGIPTDTNFKQLLDLLNATPSSVKFSQEEP